MAPTVFSYTVAYLALGNWIETMRREGYEIDGSHLTVIVKEFTQKKWTLWEPGSGCAQEFSGK